MRRGIYTYTTVRAALIACVVFALVIGLCSVFSDVPALPLALFTLMGGPAALMIIGMTAGFLPMGLCTAGLLTAFAVTGTALIAAGAALFLLPALVAFGVCLKRRTPFWQACGIVTGLLMGAQLILYLFLQNRTGGQAALAAGSLAAQYVNGLSVRDQLLYNLASAGFLEVPAAMRESAIVSVPGGYALSAAVVNELLLQLRSMIGLTVESLVPSLFITGSGLNALLGLSLGIRYGTRAAQTRAFRRDEELQQVPDLGMPPLREWHLPRPWGLRIGVLGIGYFLARYASGGSLVMLGQLMFQVFALCFGVQGLASMNASQHKRGSSRGWRTAVVVMALVFRFMQIALIIMGVVDQIINVRGLRPPMRPHGEEEE